MQLDGSSLKVDKVRYASSSAVELWLARWLRFCLPYGASTCLVGGARPRLVPALRIAGHGRLTARRLAGRRRSARLALTPRLARQRRSASLGGCVSARSVPVSGRFRLALRRVGVGSLGGRSYRSIGAGAVPRWAVAIQGSVDHLASLGSGAPLCLVIVLWLARRCIGSTSQRCSDLLGADALASLQRRISKAAGAPARLALVPLGLQLVWVFKHTVWTPSSNFVE